VLKKAGIVVATSVAALLAVSPLAFAGDMSDGGDGGGGHHSRSHHDGSDKDDHDGRGGGRGSSTNDLNCTQDNRTNNTNRVTTAGIVAIGNITANVNPQCNLDQNDILRNAAFGIGQIGNNQGGG
jgi:hypothetical protein